MPLSPPTIKSEVSACSDNILTEGNLNGATVKVFQNISTQIGQGTANSSQKWISIDSGVTLNQGDLITATQTLGADVSVQSPQPKEVQGAPSNPPAPIFKTHLFGCAKCLHLGGMVPGAEYTVIGQNQSTMADEERANNTSSGGSSHVRLNQPLWTGEKLKANEEACGTPSGFANAQPAEQYPANKLPVPTVNPPLYECDTNVYGSDCVEGFFAFMRREDNSVLVQEDDQCSLGQANFKATPILKENEEVFMWLESPPGVVDNDTGRGLCPSKGNNSTIETVLGLDMIPPPHIMTPLCAGGVAVSLKNLRPGAKVIITHDGVDFIGQATGTGQQEFFVDPLKGGKTVHAIMEICGIKTGKSNVVTVKEELLNIPPPKLQDPLFSCTDVVHVSEIHPGALVLVYSNSIGLIGAKYVYDDEADISVAPGLMDTDQIYARQTGCGALSGDSNLVTVQKPEKLSKPEVVTPLTDCSEYVKVEKVVPGAIVEIYVNGNYAGSATVSQGEGSVKVSATLEQGDKVKARQRLCDLISDFSVEVTVEEFIGKWEDIEWRDTNGNPIDDEDKILAVHATLLRTGKILFFGGDQHTENLNATNNIDHTRLMDVDTFRIAKVTGLTNPPTDVFCAGHAQTADGDLLVAGGTHKWRLPGEEIDHAAHEHFIGTRETWQFNTYAESWSRKGRLNHERVDDFINEHLDSFKAEFPNATAQEIADKEADLTAKADTSDNNALIHKTGGKWYPTVITLPDGKLLCVSGHPREEDSRHNNNSLEIYDTDTGNWDLVGNKDADLIPRSSGRSYEYPRLFVLSDGSVMSAYDMNDDKVHKWTVGNDSDNWTQVGNGTPESDPHSRLNGSAILLPFRLLATKSDYHPDKVLMIGGRQPTMLEPLVGTFVWQDTAARKLKLSGDPPRRRNHGSVILPTGEIFVEGGVRTVDDDGTGVKAAEIYDAIADEWFTLPEAKVVRNYHHVSLLLPNGSIYVGGSNVNANSGLGARIFDIEVFKPWYFCRYRPVLEEVPAKICHDSSIVITSPDHDSIAKVVIVRCGTTTHNFNCDQRLVELQFTRTNVANQLEVTMLDIPNIAIVGYYLLFILDRKNVPSKGKFIQVCQKSKCFIATAIYGPNSQELHVLRKWRDHLLESVLGRLFVRCYQVLSPSIARLLKKYSRLRAPVRIVLDSIVALITSLRN